MLHLILPEGYLDKAQASAQQYTELGLKPNKGVIEVSSWLEYRPLYEQEIKHTHHYNSIKQLYSL